MTKHGTTIRPSIAIALTVCLAVTACSEARKAGGYLAGEAKVSNQQASTDVGPPPRAVYVAQFTVAADAIKQQGGMLGSAEQMVGTRPHLLGGGLLGGGGGDQGGGGIIARRTAPDNPTAEQVNDILTKAIIEGLQSEQLGFPVEALPPGAQPPATGWLVQGQLENVDPGNRVQRAVIGFGAGEATTEVAVEVDRLGPGSVTPVLQFGSNADSGHAPGAAVTMNPYAAAAKFVLGRNATSRDVEKMGQAIAEEIAKYARERGVAPPKAS
jgi:hypothetical protein